MVLLNTVLPVFLIFLSGYIVQKKFQPDIKSVSLVALYVLSPALTFRAFYDTKLNTQILYTVIVTLLLLASLIAITNLTSRAFRYNTLDESALMLSTAFMNSGNYGAPIILFAFGKEGFNYAILIMVLHSIVMSVFGVYFASRGQGGVKQALQNVVKMPHIYSVLLGLILQYSHVHIPDTYYQAINLVGEASIPVVMVILGMQLATIRIEDFDGKTISIGSAIRLLLSPLICAGICLLFPIDPLLQKVLIVTAAMPSAATTVMYAIQFDTKPQLVSSITFVTTVMSFFTISLLLYIIV